MFLSLICKSPDLDEDDEIAEDEEEFALHQDQEWLVNPETAGGFGWCRFGFGWVMGV